MNKKVLIGLGVLAVAGVAFYMWKKKQGESSETETAVASEEKANAIGRNSTLRFSPSRVAPVVASNRVVATKSTSKGCPCYDAKGVYIGDNENCCNTLPS
jgi:hypothetical protein